MQRRTQSNNDMNALIGLGCLMLLFKFAVLAAFVYLVIYAINAFS